MSTRYYLVRRPAIVGFIISGLIFLVLELAISYNSSSSILFLISLGFGYLVGHLISVVKYNLNWLKWGLIISLLYMPIFLSFSNDNPDWNILLAIATLPGLKILNCLLGSHFSADYPSLAYFIMILAAGLITLLILFLIGSAAGLFWNQVKRIGNGIATS